MDRSVAVGGCLRMFGLMSVTKSQIISRGLANRCPNCGAKTLFPPGSLRIRRRCPECGVGLDRGEGFFLGPVVVNYTIAVFIFVLPAIVAGVHGTIPWVLMLILAGLGCTVIPVLLYRSSWSWWLMLYFYFMPERLPANGGPLGAGEED
jgi:uncharacterized protein (DUF983 family)